MLDSLSSIAAELRQRGIPVSISQQADAARALAAIDPLDRVEVYAALSATLVRREEHLPALLTILDIFLDSTAPASSGLEDADDQALHALLRSAMQRFDKRTLRMIAAEAVRRHGGFTPGRQVAGTYYVTRTLRWLDLDRLEQDIAPVMADGPERLAAQDLARRRAVFVREAVDAVVRGLLVADLGETELARQRRMPLLEEIDIMHASTVQLRQLERAIMPVARRLARRLRQRTFAPAKPDLRRTFRKAMANGGLVLDLEQARRRKRVPPIIVIADISGSVASFAQFTISLLRALSQTFSRARYFAFVDGIEEVTQDVAKSGSALDLAGLMARRSGLVRADGRTDYGYALQTFVERWGKSLDQDAIVLVLGDGRSNYRASGEDALASIARQVRHVHWLNPEPRESWGTGDSAVSQYRDHLTSMVACRNLGQLQRFVAHLV